MSRPYKLPSLLLLALLAFSEMAFAQGQLTTALAPARVEKLVNPGSKVQDVITLTNQGDVPVTVSLSIVDFDVTDTGDVLELPPGSHPSSIAPYFRISPLRTTVAPKGQASFRYTIDTPEAFEQLRAFVYFESAPNVSESEGKQVLFATAMGIPLYVENRRSGQGTLTVHDVQWERNTENPGFLDVTLSVTNEGDRNIRPKGFLAIRSADDNFSETFDVNTTGDVVLPGHKRHLRFQFGPVPEDELIVKLDFDTSFRSSMQSEYRIPQTGD